MMAVHNLEAESLEGIEMGLLLEGVAARYGYDFRDYAPGPLKRSVLMALDAEGVTTISALLDRILHRPGSLDRFLAIVGVKVTALFRETAALRCVRDEVMPWLATYPSVRIWVAGCATGEEVYSLAILLREAGLERRTSIYATDMDGAALATATRGVYPLDAVQTREISYRESGGASSLSSHYTIAGDTAVFDRSLQANVTWARHNLVTDGSFNDFHLIVCANVLIYFRRTLQERVHGLIDESLVATGFIMLGRRESLTFSPHRGAYRQVRDGVSVFRRAR